MYGVTMITSSESFRLIVVRPEQRPRGPVFPLRKASPLLPIVFWFCDQARDGKTLTAPEFHGRFSAPHGQRRNRDCAVSAPS